MFGWSDCHLYEFNDKKDYFDKATFRITVPSEYDAEYEEKTYNAFRKKLQSVFPKTEQLTYVHDYGDNWHFEILLEGSSSSDYPFAHCSDGGGATPPEDCGGTDGYEAMKRSFANQDDEMESFREWLGMKSNENWDSDFFSPQILRYINIALIYLHGEEKRFLRRNLSVLSVHFALLYGCSFVIASGYSGNSSATFFPRCYVVCLHLF